MVVVKKKPRLNQKRSQIKLRVLPETKEALKKLAKAKGTTLNNLGTLLIDDRFQKKPSFQSDLFANQTFKPGINPDVLNLYRNLVEMYSKFKLTMAEDCILYQADCARFMTILDKLIKLLQS